MLLHSSNSQLLLCVISFWVIHLARKLILADVNLEALFTVSAGIMFYAVLVGKRCSQDIYSELIFSHMVTPFRSIIRKNRDDLIILTLTKRFSNKKRACGDRRVLPS